MCRAATTGYSGPYRKHKSAASLGSSVKRSAFAQCVDGEDHLAIASSASSGPDTRFGAGLVNAAAAVAASKP